VHRFSGCSPEVRHPMVLKPESFPCIRQAQACSFGVRNPELSHGAHSRYIYPCSLFHFAKDLIFPSFDKKKQLPYC